MKFFSEAKNFLRNFFIISRLDIQVGTPANSLIGILFGAEKIHDILNLFVLLYLILSFLIVTFASNINCFFDVEVDKRYKKKLSDAVYSIGKNKILIILFMEFIIITLLIIFLYMKGYIITSLLAITGVVLAITYSAPPRIKKMGYISPLPTFIGLYLFVPVGGWFMVSKKADIYTVLFFLSYLFLNSGFILINVVEDYKEDEEESIKTWAHVFGIKNTLKISFSFILSGSIAVLIILTRILEKIPSIYALFGLFFIAISFAGILISSFDVYKLICHHPPALIKTCAKKMPLWFVITRYPMALSLFFMLFL